MSEQTLAISFSLPSGEDDDHEYLIIEQEPWGEDVGKTTFLQGLTGIAAVVYGRLYYEKNCQGDANGFDMKVYVYPSSVSMSYQFHISHGEYTPAGSEIIVRDEMIQCGFEDSAEINYPRSSTALPSLQWLGPCYDNTGTIVSRPTITMEGRTILFSKKVYGSLRVRYSVYRVTYNVRVEERDDSIENNFQSVVYCNWDGGIKWLNIDPPSGYDYDKGDCGNGFYGYYDEYGNWVWATSLPGSTEIDPDDEDEIPVAPERDRKIVKDYCSQETTSDTIS